MCWSLSHSLGVASLRSSLLTRKSRLTKCDALSVGRVHTIGPRYEDNPPALLANVIDFSATNANCTSRTRHIICTFFLFLLVASSLTAIDFEPTAFTHLCFSSQPILSCLPFPFTLCFLCPCKTMKVVPDNLHLFPHPSLEAIIVVRSRPSLCPATQSTLHSSS